MHRPHCHKLSKPDAVHAVVVPQSNSENAGIISKLDLEAPLRGFVLLAGFGEIVEVHNATHQGEVAWARLETANVCFFVIEGWLRIIN